jgi:hypothetical protein
VRAIGADGSVQPAPTDPQIAGKHTYWESNGQITRHIRLSRLRGDQTDVLQGRITP